MTNIKYIVYIGNEKFKFDSEFINTVINFAEIAKRYSVTNSEINIQIVKEEEKSDY